MKKNPPTSSTDPDIAPLLCWVVTEGLVGTENQCLGVTNALGIDPIVKRVALNAPWDKLSPYLAFEQDFTFSPPFSPPWPDILITSGRKSIAVARYIEKKSKGRTITIHLQDPRVGRDIFDMICVAEHDPARGENVFVTLAAPNKITHSALREARADFPELGSYKSPRIAVLLGGRSKAYDMTPDVADEISDQLLRLDGSLLITCSRRTGEENLKIFETKLKNQRNYFWDGQGNNPYMAILAWADAIIVTADSVSMLSEASTTGKPVHMIRLNGGSKRIKKLHDNLIEYGAVRVFRGSLEHWTYEPLCDATNIANEIRDRFGLFNNILLD